jgi:TatA/E family protein of Tat protein translocase
MNVGPLEILVILVIALLIFGPNRLPELARTVGKGMAEMRRLQRMVQGELEGVMSETPPKAGRAAGSGDRVPEVAPGREPGGNGASGNGSSVDGPVTRAPADPGTTDTKPVADLDRDPD